jgi:fructose-1,6-bisphosphatase/inositol monophosphatase family enzyme
MGPCGLGDRGEADPSSSPDASALAATSPTHLSSARFRDAASVRYGRHMSVPAMHALLPTVIEAGELARSYFRNVTAERKADQTLVTAADRAVESFLTPRLSALLPAARILGEEFGSTGTHDADYTLTLDPIDGTAAFISGLPTWCVTIGLMRGGVPVGGITYLPMTGETYLADGEVAEWNGRALVKDTRPSGEGDLFMLTHSDYHRAEAKRFPGKIRSLGSTAYHMALVARGAAVAAVLGRPRLWDIAAGAAMLRAIGGDLRYRSGDPVDLNAYLAGERASDQLVVAAPGMIDEILALVGPRP